MNKEKLFSLLKKQTEGTLNVQEFNELTNAVNNPENEPIIYEFMENSLKNDNLEGIGAFNDVRSESLYKKITSLPEFNKGRKTVRLYTAKSFYRIAASILVISMLTLIGYRFYSYRKNQGLAMIEYKSPAGNVIQKILPDGSSVWLNANSSIRFASDFSSGNRDVFLTGEGYFDVVHRANQPFIVHTGTVHTKVLGTAFDIDAYSKHAIKVTVVRGKVRVADQDVQLALLTKSKQVSYNLITKQKIEATVKESDITSWTTGELIFNNVTLLDATETIGRRYNVTFIIADPKLKDSRFVISFKQNSDLAEILDVLAKLNHFSYEKTNSQIRINTEK